MSFALRRAIRDNDLSALMASLDEEAGTAFDLNELVNGCAPLGFATYADFPEGVEFLLARGADPKTQNYIMDLYHWKATEMPLHTVCRKIGRHNLKIAQCLVSYGAAPADTDSFGVTPLRYAVHNRNYAMIDFLLQNGADPLQQIRDSVIHRAIKDFSHDDGVTFGYIWRWMVDRGEINRAVDADGNTVLHLAAKMGATLVVETILESCICRGRCSPHVPNKNHESSLAVAVSAQNLETVYSLLNLSCRPPSDESIKSDLDRSSLVPFASPLFRAFKMTLDDGRYDEAGDRVDAALRQLRRKRRQDLFSRLCDVIVDSGHPLRGETWLDNDFDDLLLGSEGPVEFRDVLWDRIPADMVVDVRSTLESLRRRRRQPMSLKCWARLAIRTAVAKDACVSCRGKKAGLDERNALEGLTKMLGLPNQLREYVMFSNTIGEDG